MTDKQRAVIQKAMAEWLTLSKAPARATALEEVMPLLPKALARLSLILSEDDEANAWVVIDWIMDTYSFMGRQRKIAETIKRISELR